MTPFFGHHCYIYAKGGRAAEGARLLSG